MEGINRALRNQILSKAFRTLESISNDDVPCIFISYQRDDEAYAGEVSQYIMSKQLDVYFDLEDNDLRQENESRNPKGVTDAITKGLNRSNYMIVIVSPTTSKSPWVPFEIGYAFDKKGDKMKILRHKGIDKANMPSYLKVRELLQGTVSLNNFLDSIRRHHRIYENLIQKGEGVKSFSAYSSNPLSKYLDNE